MNQRLALALLGLSYAALASCGGGGGGSSSSSGGSGLRIDEVSNGFGRLLPHSVYKPNAQGFPSGELIAIRSLDDLVQNVTPNNPVQKPVSWQPTAQLPTGAPGNHYIYAKFTSDIAIDSVLSNDPAAQVSSGLKGPILIVATDPVSGATVPVRGRAFVNGQTYGGPPVGGSLQLQTWVQQSGGVISANPLFGGDGFPGSQSLAPYPNAADLVSPRTLVFVIDEDDDLSTHETFPALVQVRMRITTGVLGTNGKLLAENGLASATVGDDKVKPEVAQSPPPFSVAVIQPGNGEQNVDPMTNVLVEFTEPVQPLSIAALPTGAVPSPSGAILVQFGPSSNVVTVPFNVRPPSIYDLSRYELVPAFNFPGAGPVFAQCGVFNRVDITVNSQQFQDLSGNTNTLGPTTFFFTGEGPGIVNAPVAPDAIYVGRIGSSPSISVIDLNGFGQSTGNPTYDILSPIIQGNSNFPNNPNVKNNGATLIPSLKPGTCTIDGGSSGVFTLTKDSSLSDRLITSPLIESVGDMMLGHALDSSFNNGPAPFGCQAGFGNICAQTGLKQLNPIQSNANTLGPSAPGQFGSSSPGGENLISWSPHPNPPPLSFPPPCISPFIAGQEPTALDSSLAAPAGPGLVNLLTPGAFPLGQPELNKPPQGLLVKEQNAFFLGPSAPQTSISNCLPFQVRQQIGHFLYMVDQVRGELVVLNSNRFTVLDRIPLPDPTQLAMSPNLDFLAVTNSAADLVSFVDINPTSATFHTVVKSVKVDKGPRGIAWDTANEDILVCCEQAGSLVILSAFSFEVRKKITNQLSQPFDVAITPRQANFGLLRNVYFAYILNRNGSIALFESGPNGVNGWGYDEVIGAPTFKFNKPKAIQPDHVHLTSGVWVVHEDPLGTNGIATGLKGGAVSNMFLESGTTGQLPLVNLGQQINPQLRDIEFTVAVSIGPGQLTGLPVDIAFDNQMNLGGLPNLSNSFSAGSPIPINGKGLLRTVGVLAINTVEPSYMFLAVPNSSQGGGAVDVIQMSSGFLRFDTNPFLAGVQSVPASGASVVMDYWRQ